ncbi:hypothetical protein QR680_003415 [Steinernema hermaphroditum]|uniref:Uncharacterized protein n=1 Tax=Steinernema hermaphroditum TaxID=289476 RepID=A0AA39H6N9_9BILA|nr:hypothetical protein QR680_003415 [Steinernema hermaphroditum]
MDPSVTTAVVSRVLRGVSFFSRSKPPVTSSSSTLQHVSGGTPVTSGKKPGDIDNKQAKEENTVDDIGATLPRVQSLVTSVNVAADSQEAQPSYFGYLAGVFSSVLPSVPTQTKINDIETKIKVFARKVSRTDNH